MKTNIQKTGLRFIGLLLLNLIIFSSFAQEKMRGIYSYYRNGEEIIIDSTYSDQFYIVIKDTAQTRVIKPLLTDSFHLNLSATDTAILVFQHQNEVIVLPYSRSTITQSEALNIGYAKVYNNNARNQWRHLHIPPQFEKEEAIKERYFIDYVYDESRRLVSLSEDMIWLDAASFSEKRMSAKHKKSAGAVIILHRDKIHYGWKGILQECRGTGYSCYSFFLQEYFLVKDFRKYQRACRKFLKEIGVEQYVDPVK